MAMLKNLCFAALAWAFFGFFATTGSLYTTVLAQDPHLAEKVDAFDKMVLLKALGAWGFVGLWAAIVLVNFIGTTPPTRSRRATLLYLTLFAFLYAITVGLVFALWFYPSISLAGTAGSMGSVERRIGASCISALLASLSTLGFLSRSVLGLRRDRF